MKLQNRLLFFFIVTGSGSILSAIATFVRIEWIFSDMKALGIALSIKTLAALFISRFATTYLSRFGAKRALIHSQVMGFLSIATLYTGFQIKSLAVILFGIALSAIPFVIVNVGVTSEGRIASINESDFRKFSSKVQCATGLYFLIGSFLVPLLLKFQGIEIIFALDAVTYFVGIWILSRLSELVTVRNKSEQKEPDQNWIETLYASRKFLLYAGAPLLISAFAPLLASSKSITFTQNMPVYFRESLWSVEAITLILSGILYGIAHRWLKSRIIQAMLMLSGASLIILLVSPTPIIVVMVMLMNSFLFNMAFLKGRDDLISQETLSDKFIKSFSSLAFGYKSLVQVISPLFLTWVFSTFQMNHAIGIILSIQCVLLLGWVGAIKQKHSIENQNDVSMSLSLAMERKR